MILCPELLIQLGVRRRWPRLKSWTAGSTHTHFNQFSKPPSAIGLMWRRSVPPIADKNAHDGPEAFFCAGIPVNPVKGIFVGHDGSDAGQLQGFCSHRSFCNHGVRMGAHFNPSVEHSRAYVCRSVLRGTCYNGLAVYSGSRLAHISEFLTHIIHSLPWRPASRPPAPGNG